MQAPQTARWAAGPGTAMVGSATSLVMNAALTWLRAPGRWPGRAAGAAAGVHAATAAGAAEALAQGAQQRLRGHFPGRRPARHARRPRGAARLHAHLTLPLNPKALNPKP